jgi:RNA polymerase sigma factor (sigma-70 family)
MREDMLSTNRDLLNRFRRGEKDALVAVWRAYLPLIHSMARRGFGPYPGWRDIADIEDTVAATFVVAFEEACRLRYDGVTPFGSFLLGIGRNVMRRQMKKRGREPIVSPDSTTLATEPEESPENLLINAEQKALLARFPETLSDQERAVFLAYHRMGLSEEDVARTLEITRYLTRKLLHRAQRCFKRYLSRHGLGGNK